MFLSSEESKGHSLGTTPHDKASSLKLSAVVYSIIVYFVREEVTFSGECCKDFDNVCLELRMSVQSCQEVSA